MTRRELTGANMALNRACNHQIFSKFSICHSFSNSLQIGLECIGEATGAVDNHRTNIYRSLFIHVDNRICITICYWTAVGLLPCHSEWGCRVIPLPCYSKCSCQHLLMRYLLPARKNSFHRHPDSIDPLKDTGIARAVIPQRNNRGQ